MFPVWQILLDGKKQGIKKEGERGDNINKIILKCIKIFCTFTHLKISIKGGWLVQKELFSLPPDHRHLLL